MPETTENYHRIPVESGHDDHEIRTITINEADGIKALYCVDHKTIITFLFDVDKWTMEEAKEWVETHTTPNKDDALSEYLLADLEEDDMTKDVGLNRPTREKINASVRYKSYGELRVKDFAGQGDEDTILVRGFYTDDKEDVVGDIITKGATQRAVEKWRRWGNIRTMHDYPSGRVEAIGENDGLAWNEIVTVPVDEQTKKLIRGGVLKAYSVGIIPREYEINEERIKPEDPPWFWPLIIHDYDLVEISYVDHPANYSATIEDVSHKEFSHRSVVFKANFDGEDNTMEDNEVLDGVEDGAATDVELESPEEIEKDLEAQEDVVEKDLEAAVDAEPEFVDADSESLGSEDDGAEDEDDAESEVGEVEMSLDAELLKDLSRAVRDMEASFKSLADVLELHTEQLKALQDAIESKEDVGPSSFEFGEDEVEKISEAVARKMLSELYPSAVRSASITGEDDEDKDAGSPTLKFSGLSSNELRDAIRKTLSERY